jgi:hypothetical protein
MGREDSGVATKKGIHDAARAPSRIVYTEDTESTESTEAYTPCELVRGRDSAGHGTNKVVLFDPLSDLRRVVLCVLCARCDLCASITRTDSSPHSSASSAR